MANFLEILNAVTTGLGGLATIANQGAEQRRKQELADATLLAQLKDYEFVPAEGIERPSFLSAMAGGQGTAAGNMPVVTIGGKKMILRPRQTLFDFLQGSLGTQKAGETSQAIEQPN